MEITADRDDNITITIIEADKPKRLRPGWTVTETIGMGVLNGALLLTPVQRLYLDILKWGRGVAEITREGNVVHITIAASAAGPFNRYVLEPQDENEERNKDVV